MSRTAAGPEIERSMQLLTTVFRVFLGLVAGLALVALPIVVLLAVGGFFFIAATSGSDPGEADLPIFAFFGVIALASGLAALWSAVLPGRARVWRIVLTAVAIVVALFCGTAMLLIKGDPNARLGSTPDFTATPRAS